MGSALTLSPKSSFSLSVPSRLFFLQVREGTFFIRGGGPGPRRGGSSVKIFENGEGQNFWSGSPGEGHRFFITTKSLLHVSSMKSTLYINY